MTHPSTTARTIKDTVEKVVSNGPDPASTVLLLQARGDALDELVELADSLRREQTGERVGFVVNRNINFTNVCVKNCTFCAFSRDLRSEQGYLLPSDEILRKVAEAQAFGATEVCVQAGLVPQADGAIYIDLCRAIHEAHPSMHIHAFSPEEVLYGVRRSGLDVRTYLRKLKDAGLGSLPGTSAEILVQSVRDTISPGRIRTDQWLDIIMTAHEENIPTTSTIMYGHVETSAQIAKHLMTLRDVQLKTGGFTEFVPLAFVHTESPMYSMNLVDKTRPGATEDETRALYATARVVLGDVLPNIQASWVKHGPEVAADLLRAGANDLGGTLMNESISTTAGAGYGQLMTPSRLAALARRNGRIPFERTTLYEPIRDWPESDSGHHPLDKADADGHDFGSYDRLVEEENYRYSFGNNR